VLPARGGTLPPAACSPPSTAGAAAASGPPQVSDLDDTMVSSQDHHTAQFQHFWQGARSSADCKLVYNTGRRV
jgi:hypothetical protein